MAFDDPFRHHMRTGIMAVITISGLALMWYLAINDKFNDANLWGLGVASVLLRISLFDAEDIIKIKPDLDKKN